MRGRIAKYGRPDRSVPEQRETRCVDRVCDRRNLRDLVITVDTREVRLPIGPLPMTS